MNITILQQFILKTVEDKQGIKQIDLALKLMEQINPGSFVFNDYVEALEELIQRGEVTELEYVLPKMDYKVKSMIFPRGTSFKL